MAWTKLAGAGAGFVGVGLWRAYGRSDRSRKLDLHRNFEYILVAILSVLHILSSVVSTRRDSNAGYVVSSAVSMERSGVASMFLLYATAGILRDRTRLLPLPAEAMKLLAVIAFGLEFLLFYLKQNVGIESQYYRLLLVPIGVCTLSTGLQIGFPDSELLELVLNMALVLQGSWLIQMAISLFTRLGLSKGCSLNEQGQGDFSVHCRGMDAMRGSAMATLQFNLQLAMLLALSLPAYAFFSRNKPRTKYQQLGGELQLGENGSSNPAYVLEDEDAPQ